MVNENEIKRKSTGRTTRLLDSLIQKFFLLEIGEIVQVLDHEPTREAQTKLLTMFCNRMKLEHPNVLFEINEYNRTIKKI